MRVAYLGFLSTIFNWVFDNILSPIVKFIGTLLSSVFEFLFKNILVPILTLVLKTFIPWVIEMIKTLLADIFYNLLAILCKILDYAQEMFDIFAGVQPVTYDGKEMPLLDALVSMPAVRTIFILIVVTALFLTFICAIIGVGKSTLDFDFEGKRNVGAVMRALLKCLITMLLLPLSFYFLLALSGVILNTITTASEIARGGAGDTSLGRIVFCVATLDASKGNDNISNTSYSGVDNIFESDSRIHFYSKGQGALDYSDPDAVKKYFDIQKLDFLSGYIVCIFMAIVLLAAGIVFVQRIFELLILGCLSPFFVSTMPLDDGEKYKKWKELFIAKIFSGYGSVLAMDLFLSLVPFIMGNSITWGKSDAQSTYIIKIVFLCGGAYAVTKIGPMVTTLLNWQAGQAEGKANALAMGWADSLASKGLESAATKIGEKYKESKEAGKKRKAFADAKWKSTLKEMEKGFPGADGGDAPGDDGGDGGLGGNGGEGQEQGNAADINEPLNNNAEGALGENDAQANGDQADGQANPGDMRAALAAKYDVGALGGENPMTAESLGGGRGSKNPNKTNKFNKFIDKAAAFAHRVLPHKVDAKGNYSFGLLGCRITWDKNGKRIGYKAPCLSWQYGADGNAHLTKFNALGLFSMTRHGRDGKFGLSSIPAIGLQRREGLDGNMQVTSALGTKWNIDPNGVNRCHSILGVKVGMSYNKESGNYEATGFRVGNFIFGASEYNTTEKFLANQKEEEQQQQQQNKK